MIDMELSKASGRLDMVVEGGALQFVNGEDELRQRVEFGLEFFQNDWAFDLGFGIPYYGRVFQRGVNTDDLYGIFRFAIEREPGINSVRRLDIEVDAQMRALIVSGSALSDTGAEIGIDSMSGVA